MARKTKATGKFLDQMHRLGKGFGRELDDDQLAVYWSGLEDLAPGKLDAAIDVAIRKFQWLPKIAELREIANEIGCRADRYIDGERVHDCPLCLDGGTISVWHPKTMRAARLGKDAHGLTCCVACTCPAGDQWARRRVIGPKEWAALPRYDASKMRRPQFTFERDGETHVAITGRYGKRERADLEAWIDQPCDVTVSPNYHDFGEHSYEQQRAF
jgi:hypothetical protein